MSLLRQFLRLIVTPRVSIAALDQAVVSLRILAATIIVATSLDGQHFGVFSIILTTHLIAEGAVVAACGEPFLARHSSSAPLVLREATGAATGFAVLAILPLSLLTAAASIFSPHPLATALLLLSVGMPGLLLQPIWRYVFLARGSPRTALVNDALNGLLQLTALTLVLASSRESVVTFVAAWTVPPLICAVVGAKQAGVLPDLRASLGWLREQRPVMLPYVGEFLAGQGAAHLTTYMVAVIAGLSAAGALRAGLVLYGPLTVLFMSARNIGQVEMVRLFNQRENDPGLVRLAIYIGALCAAGALLYGAVLVNVPHPVGMALLGETWTGAATILLPLAVLKASQGGLVGSVVGLRVLLEVRRGFQGKILGGGALFVCASAGALLGGLYGAAVGLALGGTFAAIVLWSLFLSAKAELQQNGGTSELLRIRHNAHDSPGA